MTLETRRDMLPRRMSSELPGVRDAPNMMQEQILARVLESPSLVYVMFDEGCAGLTAFLIPVEGV